MPADTRRSDLRTPEGERRAQAQGGTGRAKVGPRPGLVQSLHWSQSGEAAQVNMNMGVRGKAESRAREGKVTETKIRERRAGGGINQGRNQTCNEGPKLSAGWEEQNQVIVGWLIARVKSMELIYFEMRVFNSP